MTLFVNKFGYINFEDKNIKFFPDAFCRLVYFS